MTGTAEGTPAGVAVADAQVRHQPHRARPDHRDQHTLGPGCRSEPQCVGHRERDDVGRRLDPEPRGYWDTGDSIVGEYGIHCDGTFECRNLRQLERFVAAVIEA